MIRNKEVPLRIELLSDGEDSQFRIRSKREILSILNKIAQEETRAALYYDDENDFILVTLTKVSEHGMWLNVDASTPLDPRILRSNKMVFISSHHQVKVQFVANRIEGAMPESRAALFLPMPDSILRIQRREYFRLTTPVNNPLRCVIPLPFPSDANDSVIPDSKREVTIMDISGGGIALVCETHDAELHPGTIYEDCRIALPSVGTISATIRVRNSFEITLHDGQVRKRAGCEFAGLSGEAAAILQRYIAHLQSASRMTT